MKKKITGRPPKDEDLRRKKMTITLSVEETEAVKEVAAAQRDSYGATIGRIMLREQKKLHR